MFKSVFQLFRGKKKPQPPQSPPPSQPPPGSPSFASTAVPSRSAVARRTAGFPPAGVQPDEPPQAVHAPGAEAAARPGKAPPGLPPAPVIDPAASPEEICGITPDMTQPEILTRLAVLYQRHNRAASSFDPALRDEAEFMLETLSALREKYTDATDPA